jgi:hypothetical protein
VSNGIKNPITPALAAQVELPGVMPQLLLAIFTEKASSSLGHQRLFHFSFVICHLAGAGYASCLRCAEFFRCYQPGTVGEKK